MKVTYLGPVAECADHPAIQEMPVSDLPASSFLVEVAPDAGVDGELIEGDVLVGDENRIAEYGDVVLACDECDEMRAYHSHRIGGYLRLVPMGGGQAVPATSLDCVGVVVRRARNPANDIQQETPTMAITLAEAFEPWYRMSTWHTRGPNNDKTFYRCCYEFFQVHGGRAGAEEFREHLRDVIPRRGDGNWLELHEEKLGEYASDFEVIFLYLSDTGQISSRNS
ncbi:hypothetical protein [Salinicola socius]|uniref:Peptidase S24/S26A/S26B/S26C domain-containing protein n=1 Tax=Salinicola socius TaxID=404433 RepID=A0A1Q8SUI2_9GAMM|nr:hypothetical protein [Salinicola socius]OLO05094.1 hypothetical protein BTW07_05630 [Salinicola socius]